ncbi:hypothetical protein SIID45300_00887 [Candidatus Magnetaquicoccaceae bacterium FCR-1]|uniref:Uncharacterized protein n=1 Tax=Candidatus Magnetaquiglobus chichijimensis TaxID=3141448 RepID=A0ABQ0C6R8_9PROT
MPGAIVGQGGIHLFPEDRLGVPQEAQRLQTGDPVRRKLVGAVFAALLLHPAGQIRILLPTRRHQTVVAGGAKPCQGLEPGLPRRLATIPDKADRLQPRLFVRLQPTFLAGGAYSFDPDGQFRILRCVPAGIKVSMRGEKNFQGAATFIPEQTSRIPDKPQPLQLFHPFRLQPSFLVQLAHPLGPFRQLRLFGAGIRDPGVTVLVDETLETGHLQGPGMGLQIPDESQPFQLFQARGRQFFPLARQTLAFRPVTQFRILRAWVGYEGLTGPGDVSLEAGQLPGPGVGLQIPDKADLFESCLPCRVQLTTDTGQTHPACPGGQFRSLGQVGRHRAMTMQPTELNQLPVTLVLGIAQHPQQRRDQSLPIHRGPTGENPHPGQERFGIEDAASSPLFHGGANVRAQGRIPGDKPLQQLPQQRVGPDSIRVDHQRDDQERWCFGP